MSADESLPRFAVVDVETSGLSVRRHHLLQVGIVVVDADGTVLDRWSSLVRPRWRWFARVGPTELHGIRRSDVRHAPPLTEVLSHLAPMLAGTVFVAHNAEFDLAFLRKAEHQTGIRLPIDTVLCTLQLSRQLDPGRTTSHRLGAICERYGVELVRPHDALADADATAAVLPHLLRANGITSIEQLSVQTSAA
jgi:DNA polymerase-3 subunit epsilon